MNLETKIWIVNNWELLVLIPLIIFFLAMIYYLIIKPSLFANKENQDG